MTSEKLIRPRRETAESKAETTKRVSQEITQTEADIRKAKTLRLKAARLANQEGLPEPAPAKIGTRKAKTTKKSKV